MINVGKLHVELEKAGLTVCSVNSNGKIAYTREITPAEKKTVKVIVANHQPEDEVATFFGSLSTAGIGRDKFLYGLWLVITEGDTRVIDEIKLAMKGEAK